MQKTWVITGCVVMAILILAILAKVTQGLNRTVSKQTIQNAGILLKGSSKWALAAQQDKNPMFSVIHISYALAYANALREVLNDREIQVATGVDMREHVESMEILQRQAITKLGDRCPKIRPDGGFAIASGWLG